MSNKPGFNQQQTGSSGSNPSSQSTNRNYQFPSQQQHPGQQQHQQNFHQSNQHHYAGNQQGRGHHPGQSHPNRPQGHHQHSGSAQQHMKHMHHQYQGQTHQNKSNVVDVLDLHLLETIEYPYCTDHSKYENLAKIGQGTFG